MNQKYGFIWLLAMFILAGDLCFGGSQESQLRIGKAVNIFVRYGYLSISMKVISYNDTERWLFKEPTKTIYKNLNALTETREENAPGIFHGDFHMEFCDNRRQLYQAYFRDFTIERLDKPWEAFTGGWHAEVAAKKLGINTSFVRGDYSYVLVRVVRFRETGKLKIDIPPNQSLQPDVANRVQSLKVGNITNAVKFMEAFGTHYINSYTTGNSLYQVFVYNRKNYQTIKDRLKTKGISSLSKVELHNFFGPWCAEHLGQIRTASGNSTVERWAHTQLFKEYHIYSYTNLLNLHGNSTLLRSVDALLGNEAVLQLDLKVLNVMSAYADKKKWFEETLDNYLKLWEINMGQSMEDSSQELVHEFR